ncbi:MAG: hypothetical protein ABI336_00050 [Humibacillus sp.]
MTSEEQQDELLIRATEDWVHPGDVFDVARYAGFEEEDAYLEQAIYLTRRLIVDAFVVAGDVTGEGFRPWLLPPEDAAHKIAEQWRADPDSAPSSYDVWLCATPAGLARGERALADDRPSPD